MKNIEKFLYFPKAQGKVDWDQEILWNRFHQHGWYNSFLERFFRYIQNNENRNLFYNKFKILFLFL